jgi:hypothetical protein
VSRTLAPSQLARFAAPSMALLALLASATAFAHGVAGGDQQFLEQAAGSQIVPFMYLGAKHMVTGYDHLLFLVGVIFFLYRVRDVALYVTLFSVGHSITLLYGVLSGTNVNPHIVDAIIGFSVVYKGLDNLGLLKRWLGSQPSTKGAVLLFGLFHGFGLATKLQDFSLSEDGLVGNILAFNVGVEIGQFLALGVVLIGMGFWRRMDSFKRHASRANVALIVAGLALVIYQMNGFFQS